MEVKNLSRNSDVFDGAYGKITFDGASKRLSSRCLNQNKILRRNKWYLNKKDIFVALLGLVM